MPTLSEVIKFIEQGRYAIPEIQRPYVWRNKQVLELFDSIYRNFPIGSILTWDMPRGLVEEYGDLLRPLVDELEDRRVNFQFMVIDGQQRLVSIYLVKKGFIKTVGRERSIALYFNPISNTERLRLARGKELEKETYWFKVSDILNADTITDVLERKVEVTGDEDVFKNKKVQKELEDFRSKLLNYSINIYQVPEDALRYNQQVDNFLEILEKISEIFVRLNSTGTRIKIADLITAILTAKTRKVIGESFKSKARETIEYFDDRGWDIDEPVLMRTYMAIATDTANFREARSKLETMDSRNITEFLEYTKSALELMCFNVLSKELNVKKADYLKSKYSLVTLAYYAYKKDFSITPNDVSSISRWLILSSFNRRYTGRLESDLREDIGLINEGKGLKDLENKLTSREVSETMLDGTYDNEHLTALLIMLKDSYDLGKGIPRRISELRPEDLEIHHIFPRDLLAKVYGKDGKIGELDVESAYDLVANITITSKSANSAIKNRRPDEYLKEIDETVLRNHYIPIDQELWKPENYKEFVNKRKELLFQGIKNVLES